MLIAARRFRPNATPAHLVAFGRYPHSTGRLAVDDRKRIETAMRFLEDPYGRSFDELPGGQRQRAFVAMVLCQDTDYVLLDEPLHNLDRKHAVGMMKRLRRIIDELSKKVVIVLHEINFASCYSDQIVVMKQGQLAHQGPPATVMTPLVLRDIYGVDVRVHAIDGHHIGSYFA